jgi:hypothetical protein
MKWLKIALAVVAMVAGMMLNSRQASAAVQWKVEDGGNGHWYEAVYVTEGITWPVARDAAYARGGYLACLTSAEENQFAYSHSLIDPNNYYLWLGGYQDHNSPDYSEPAGGWTWLSGESWNYTNWDPGWPEPNNGDGGWEEWGDQDVLASTSGGLWDDGWADGAWTSGAYGYVVEYNSQSIPEPTTLIIWALLGGLAITVDWWRRRWTS